MCIFICELRVYLYLANNLFCIKEDQVIESRMCIVCCWKSWLSQLIWMHSCSVYYKSTCSVDQASCFSWKYPRVGLFCIWLQIWKSYYSTSQLTCIGGYPPSIKFLVNFFFLVGTLLLNKAVCGTSVRCTGESSMSCRRSRRQATFPQRRLLRVAGEDAVVFAFCCLVSLMVSPSTMTTR
jgi:hypothetical protein